MSEHGENRVSRFLNDNADLAQRQYGTTMREFKRWAYGIEGEHPVRGAARFVAALIGMFGVATYGAAMIVDKQVSRLSASIARRLPLPR